MRNLTYILFSVMVLGACQPDEEQSLPQQIDAMEAQMKKLDALDTVLAREMIAAYQQYATENPEDSLTPVYLYKAGNVYRAWPGKQAKALELYKRVVKEYKNAPQAPEAAFASAFVFEEIGDRPRAAGAYRYIIRNYPKHPLASDAENLLMMLNDTETSDLERVQQWMENAKNKESQKE